MAPDRPSHLPPEVPGDPSRRYWYGVLTLFPFFYFPIVAAIAVLCAIVMPFLRNY